MSPSSGHSFHNNPIALSCIQCPIRLDLWNIKILLKRMHLKVRILHLVHLANHINDDLDCSVVLGLVGKTRFENIMELLVVTVGDAGATHLGGDLREAILLSIHVKDS